MSQHDYVIDDQPGSTFLSDLNAALAAIVTNNSGATAPSPTYPYQFWLDTSTGYLKIRNAANSGWVTAFKLLDMSMTAGDLAYTGTLTGGTGVINIGSGQIYKDASGNVGFGATPHSGTSSKLTTNASVTLSGADYLSFLSNAYYDGAWKYTGNGVAWGIGNNFNGTTGYATIATAASNSGGAGAAITWIPTLSVGAGNTLHISPLGGFGYGTGAGGTATQPTSKTSAVTLSKPSGQITLNNSSLAAGATAFFTINNSLITDKDTPIITRQSGGTNQAYQFGIDSVATGSCVAWVKNITAGALAEAIIVNFHLNRGSAS